MGKFETAIEAIVVAAGFAAYVGGWALLARNGDVNNRTYETAREIADSNGDGRTSLPEWAKVYDELGVPFDELNPEKLSEGQLKEYIQKHQ